MHYMHSYTSVHVDILSFRYYYKENKKDGYRQRNVRQFLQSTIVALGLYKGDL